MLNETTKTAGGVGLPPGARIGKYEVVERLGMGGQAIIYKCYDSLLDRHVAIKQISGHLAEDPKFLERFRKEAQILARLGAHQPAIVTIHELVEDERGLFIVMEYVPGNTLETVLEGNPQAIEPKAVLQIIWRLAAALHDVHTAGIIHRDIKPGNIIVAEGLRPKITDFGVAASLTGQTSMLLGTTKYMAPELLSGSTFDGRADMYSLGFVAYEMLVGRAKFNEIFADLVRDKHSEALRWMKWHSNPAVQAPRLTEVNPAVPVALSDIVAKMIAKEPSERFANMEALGRAIKATFSPRAKAAEAPRGPKVHRRRAAAIAGAVGAGAVAAGIGAGAPAQGVAGRAVAPDEGDEFEVVSPAAGPSTAKIPRKPMTRRTKIMLAAVAAGVVAIGVIALAVMSNIRAGEAERRSATIYFGAKDAFDKHDYDKAIKGYKALLAQFPGTDRARIAAVMLPFSEAHRAVMNKEWQLAADKEDEANRARDNLARTASGELLKWARDREKDLQAFGPYRTACKAFDGAMAAAREALKSDKTGRFEEARSVLKEKLGGAELTPDQSSQMQQLLDQITHDEFLASCADMIKSGKDLVAEGKLAEAEKAFNDVMAKLNLPEADKILRKDERAALQDDVSKQIKDLGGERELAKLMDDMKRARDSNNKKVELETIQKILKVKADDELVKRSVDLRAMMAFEAGQQAEAQKNYREAARQYVESLRIKEKDNPEPKAALDRIANYEKRDQLIAEGKSLLATGKMDEALDKFQQAKALPAPPGSADAESKLAEAILQARTRQALAKADALRDAKKYDEALAAYEVIRTQINPAMASLIDARCREVMTSKKYDEFIKAGDDFLAAAAWAKATDQYNKAVDVRTKAGLDAAEAKAKLSRLRCLQNMAACKAAIEQKSKVVARFHVKIAEDNAPDDLKPQVAELRKQVEALPDE